MHKLSVNMSVTAVADYHECFKQDSEWSVGSVLDLSSSVKLQYFAVASNGYILSWFSNFLNICTQIFTKW